MRFAALFVPEAITAAVSDEAWVAALVAMEVALVRAHGDVGAIAPDRAAGLAAALEGIAVDTAAVVADARAVGNPAEPVVRALRAGVSAEDGALVHRGATSQDAMDTAAMLVARDAFALLGGERTRAADACAALARAHRDTPMVARTLLQPALPTTFGAHAAGWLAGFTRARGAAASIAGGDVLAVQLGGPAATLSALGAAGPATVGALAARLGLAAPAQPWHTERGRLIELAAALALDAAAADKIARDVALLAQVEVAEVAEGRPGGSSAMAHKRNPTGSVLAAACAQRAKAHAAALIVAPPHEHGRAAGAWHAEWDTLSELLSAAGGALAHAADVLEDLRVDPARMARNLAAFAAATPGVDPADTGSAALFVERALAAHAA